MLALTKLASFLLLSLASLIVECYELPKPVGEKLLLISFDGFRYDYLAMVKSAGRALPNFDRFIHDGLQVAWLHNAFITKTFPNHYTLVTGRYEESHGIVGNEMYDPIMNSTFLIKSNEKNKADWWNLGDPEPIWTTNQKDGSGKSGVVFWPGSEANMGDKSPTHFLDYDSSMKNESRVDKAVQWLKGNGTRSPVNLALSYFSEPDNAGHHQGPDSEHMIDVIVGLDKVMGYLIDEMKKADLWDITNIIITSDHGMAEIHDYIVVPKSLAELYIAYDSAPIWNIRPKEGKATQIYEEFKKIKHLKVYWKHEIPESMHYKNNRRVQDIIVIADNGYLMCDDVYSMCNDTTNRNGGHGYSNDQPNMRPFFIARGPDVRKLGGAYVAPFNNTDLYPLLCHLLQVQPGTHNGSLARSSVVLRGYQIPLPPSSPEQLLVQRSAARSKEGSRRDEYLFPGGFTLTAVTMMITVIFSLGFAATFCLAAVYSRRTAFKYKSKLAALPMSRPEEYHVNLLASENESEIEELG